VRTLAGGRMRPEERYDLLLRAVLGPIDGAADALRRWRAVEDLSDPDMGVLRLLPLLGERVAELAPDDAALRRRVAHISRFAWMRGQLMLTRTVAGVAALQDAGIAVLLIKGAALIQIPGVERRLRMMDDLDVLVHPEDVRAASDVLHNAGYRRLLAPASDDELVRLLRSAHALPFGDQGGEIDLHWNALHSRRHPEFDRAWWPEAVPARLLDVETLAAAPSDVLVQSIAHGSMWAQDAAPRWVVDIAMLLQATGETLDWDRVVDRAAAARLAPVVADALEYVEEATGLAAPATALTALRAAPVPLAERLRARRPVDPSDGGPVPPGPLGRVVEAYETRACVDVAPGARTGPADGARMLAREWWVPSARTVPAEAAFLAGGRPWPLRRLARRAVGAATRGAPGVPRYEIGRVLSFKAGGDGAPFLRGGWFHPEGFGTWTQGTPSQIVLPLDERVDRDITLELQLVGFTTPYVPTLRAELAVNDVCVARMRFSDPSKPIVIVRTRIPAAAVRGWDRLELRLVARHPVTPAEAREGTDLRRLALGLVKLGTA
jgi:Uncharacterised nucleotidyltransferase